MASKPSILLLLLFFPSIAISTLDHGIRLELTHVDMHGNFTAVKLIGRAADRSQRRVNSLLGTLASSSPAAKNVTTTVHASTASYLMDLAIGTPPLAFSAILDTGSDLIWTQCDAPCRKCFPQRTPVYAPSKSTTFAAVPCNSTLCEALPTSNCSLDCAYYYSYGDGSSTEGILATEAFTFGSNAGPAVTVHGIGFGCGTRNLGGTDNSSGLVGMGRGPLSLVSQLGVTRFSYCFTPFNDTRSSPLFLGSLATLSSTSGAKSTPFVPNPSGTPRSSFYYLSLEGITVGETLLPIDPTVFQLTAQGSGGLMIDSGTTVTALEERAFLVLARALVAHVNLPLASGAHLGLSLCFAVQEAGEAVHVPRLVFHFDNADMELARENYIVEDRSAGLLCLGMVSTRGISIFGNLQQQNMHILYDLERGMLSFERKKCAEI